MILSKKKNNKDSQDLELNRLRKFAIINKINSILPKIRINPHMGKIIIFLIRQTTEKENFKDIKEAYLPIIE